MCEMNLTNTIEDFMKKMGTEDPEQNRINENTILTDDMKLFINICKMDQKTLKAYLYGWLQNEYANQNLISEDGFLFAKGNIPVLLTAHMDTVHLETAKDIYSFDIDGQTYLTSTQGIGGDDRCGIYMIVKMINDIKDSASLPYVLFCEDEEIGGVGSNKFVNSKYINEIKNLKFYIELDRANANDAVYYSCGNDQFKKFINDAIGYKENHGSFSDISHLSPATDVASVNLSCGYYRAHTVDEYVNWQEMDSTIKSVKFLLKTAVGNETSNYDYQEKTYGSYGVYGLDDYFYDYGKKSYRKAYSLRDEFTCEYVGYFFYLDKKNKEQECMITGDSQLSCIAKFLLENPDVAWDDVLDYCFDEASY